MPFSRLESILAEARPLAETFRAGGHRLYLVGGIVRELYLDAEIGAEADLDLTTEAEPDQIKALVEPLASALWLQGERFGTVGATVEGRDYEITTHRVETYAPDSRKPLVEFSSAVEADLSRRDFTVNAMAIDIVSGELIDPFDGAGDLAQRRLQTPLDPEVSLSDDPLRMLRAARFSTAYGLVPHPDLVVAMASLATRLDIVSAERIRDEFDKLLAIADPVAGIGLLSETGLLERFLPEVNPDSAGLVDESLRALERDPAVRLAALLFEADRSVVEPRLEALRYSTDRARWTSSVLQAAKTLASGAVLDAPSMRRWVSAAGSTRTAARELVTYLAEDGAVLAAASHGLETELAEELEDLSPALNGNEVMEILEIGPGADVGAAVDFLQELRFDRGLVDKNTAVVELQRWWSDR